MSAVASVNRRFPAPQQPGSDGRGTRPSLPARPQPSPAGFSQTALATMAEGLASVVTAESVPLPPGASRSFARLLATADWVIE